MCLIVQKFGGSSVKDAASIRRAAGIIADTCKKGNRVIAVLSAQGDTTDRLIEKAQEIASAPSPREMDMLLATGEQASVALCAMALQELGCAAVSLTGWQAGVETDENHASARIQKIWRGRIDTALAEGKVVLVTGFQGVSPGGDITTLGRGGSDTSAVALAKAFDAAVCQIYTDVDGVFTTDPRLVPQARRLSDVTCDEMLELAAQGAQVLHDRSVELAKGHDVELEVVSSLKKIPGTHIGNAAALETAAVTGITRNANVALLSILDVPDAVGPLAQIFSLLHRAGVTPDMVWQTEDTAAGRNLRFTLPQSDAAAALRCLAAARGEIGYTMASADLSCAKVSVVGNGVMHAPHVLPALLSALAQEDIAVKMLSTGALRISVLVERAAMERAVRRLHACFFDGQ